MIKTESDVLEFVKEHNIKHIRLVFCDLLGIQKNLCIMPSRLPSAFRHGVPFSAHNLKGFMTPENSNLILFPDPRTIHLLPLKEDEAIAGLFCYIQNYDLTPFALDTRNILRMAYDNLAKVGFDCKIGAECEFYLLEFGEHGNPTTIPYDRGGYLDISPFDKCAKIRREICSELECVNVTTDAAYHEQGPGQNEIDYAPLNPILSADGLVSMKMIIREVSERNNVYASFLPKPLSESKGNNLHLNFILARLNGFGVIDETGEPVPEVKSFLAGIMRLMPEITCFLNPLPDSYERFNDSDAPKFLTWSNTNCAQLIHVHKNKNIPGTIKFEIRSPDTTINPYIAFALIICAGLYGVENNLKLPDPVDVTINATNIKEFGGLIPLPQTLGVALDLTSKSSFVRDVLSDEITDAYLNIKYQEFNRYRTAVDKLNYF